MQYTWLVRPMAGGAIVLKSFINPPPSPLPLLVVMYYLVGQAEGQWGNCAEVLQ